MTVRDSRVLVIGGLGFIGVNLTSKLIERGARPTVLTPDRERHAEQASAFERPASRWSKATFAIAT